MPRSQRSNRSFRAKTGVLITPQNFIHYPLVLDESTAQYLLPGTRSIIKMFIDDLNSIPHAYFISVYPIVALVLIPVIVISAILVTIYVFPNPWVYRLAFPATLLLFVVPYCVCYHRYIHRYKMIIDYYEFQLVNHYSLEFPLAH